MLKEPLPNQNPTAWPTVERACEEAGDLPAKTKDANHI